MKSRFRHKQIHFWIGHDLKPAARACMLEVLMQMAGQTEG